VRQVVADIGVGAALAGVLAQAVGATAAFALAAAAAAAGAALAAVSRLRTAG
jgi:hypothetical protein